MTKSKWKLGENVRSSLLKLKLSGPQLLFLLPWLSLTSTQQCLLIIQRIARKLSLSLSEGHPIQFYIDRSLYIPMLLNKNLADAMQAVALLYCLRSWEKGKHVRYSRLHCVYMTPKGVPLFLVMVLLVHSRYEPTFTCSRFFSFQNIKLVNHRQRCIPYIILLHVKLQTPNTKPGIFCMQKRCISVLATKLTTMNEHHYNRDWSFILCVNWLLRL